MPTFDLNDILNTVQPTCTCLAMETSLMCTCSLSCSASSAQTSAIIARILGTLALSAPRIKELLLLWGNQIWMCNFQKWSQNHNYTNTLGDSTTVLKITWPSIQGCTKDHVIPIQGNILKITWPSVQGCTKDHVTPPFKAILKITWHQQHTIYLSIRSQRYEYTWGASSLSSTTGNHDNHIGRMLSNGTPESTYLQTLVTADIAFSTALILGRSSLALGDWMATISRGRASGKKWLTLNKYTEVSSLHIHVPHYVRN